MLNKLLSKLSSFDKKIFQSFNLRCIFCHKLLGILSLITFSLEIKCPRCYQLNNFTAIPSKKLIILTDKDGKIIFVNKYIKKLMGYSIAEVIGKKPSCLGRCMPISFYENLRDELILQKKSVITKMKNKTKDNVIFDVMVKICPILNNMGKVQYLFIVATKI